MLAGAEYIPRTQSPAPSPPYPAPPGYSHRRHPVALPVPVMAWTARHHPSQLTVSRSCRTMLAVCQQAIQIEWKCIGMSCSRGYNAWKVGIFGLCMGRVRVMRKELSIQRNSIRELEVIIFPHCCVIVWWGWGFGSALSRLITADRLGAT